MDRFAVLAGSVGLTHEDCADFARFQPVLRGALDELVTIVVAQVDGYDGGAPTNQVERWARVWLYALTSAEWCSLPFDHRRAIGLRQLALGVSPAVLPGASLRLIDRAVELLGDEDEQRVRSLLTLVLAAELAVALDIGFAEINDRSFAIPPTVASGLAHEIRNPLNSVGFHLKLLERKLDKDEQLDDATASVLVSLRDELDRVGSLISQIVDLALPLHIELSWIDADDLLLDLHTLHGPALESLAIELLTEVTGDPMVFVDRDKIQTALQLLLDNAVHAVAEQPRRWIRMSVSSTEHHSRFIVEDSGPGLGSMDARQLFEPFFTTRASGTGMGLAAVHKIARGHGGIVTIGNGPRHGTQVEILVPRPT